MTAVPSRRRSRIAHFKVPFVISVAAPGVTMACGGEAGSPEPAAAVVMYPQTNNPPPPPEISTTCPGELPADGTTCSDYARGLTCDYDYCYGEVPMVQCDEAAGVWKHLPLPSCNPPPVQPCPEAMPTAGSDCAPDGEVCGYPGCEGPESSTATCSSGQWYVEYSTGPACNPPAVVPVCPTVVPRLGADCAYEGQACAYGACGDPFNPGFVDTCIAGVWQQIEVSCAPVDAGAGDGGT
jgi:hypothetical protein